MPDKLVKKSLFLRKIVQKMPNKKEYLIELILKKLKKDIQRKINIEKKEFNEFINSLINNN